MFRSNRHAGDRIGQELRLANSGRPAAHVDRVMEIAFQVEPFTRVAARERADGGGAVDAHIFERQAVDNRVAVTGGSDGGTVENQIERIVPGDELVRHHGSERGADAAA